MPAGGDDNSFGVEGVQFTCREFRCHHTRSFSVDDQQIQHLVLIEKVDLVLQALLVEGL
jgi:hypothetical protein